MRQTAATATMCVTLAGLCCALAGAAEAVTLTVIDQDGHPVIKLENYRLQLTIDPTRGGAVTSYSDKLAPAELVLQKEFNGLCLDHFQEQLWPGEFLEQPYEYRIIQQTPELAEVLVWRKASGVWRGELADPKLSGVLLEKTYCLRADSPALTCTVRLTAPPDQPKVLSYWLQNVCFAGGDYDPVTDRTFRPSARGVRNTGRENNGPYGAEEWLRDFTAGWMALVDTKKRTGLALTTSYDDLRISYACGGNLTNELMFNTTYLPKGASRTYVVQLIPIVGLDQVACVGPEMVVGYHLRPDQVGGGQVELQVERSAAAVQRVRLKLTLVGATNTSRQADAGAVAFDALTDQPQSKSVSYTGAPPDPLVIRFVAEGVSADGSPFTARFEDFFPGAYKWADNIQTDMRTPVYAAERPAQKLSLSKPEKLALKLPYGDHYLYFEGLHDEDYGVAAAVHSTHWTQQSDVVYYSYGGSWFGSLSDFPYDYDKLLSYHAVILGGVSRSGLKPVGIEMLHDYLLAGGGMVVLGSHGAYGRSQLRGTTLGEALPVEMSDSVFDLEPTGGKPIALGPDTAAFLRYTTLSPAATCYFLHRARPRPGVQVLMQVGGKPFMVAGEYGPGRARIICLLGAPLGSPARGQTPFWKDPGWCLVLRNALWWAARRDEHFTE